MIPLRGLPLLYPVGSGPRRIKHEKSVGSRGALKIFRSILSLPAYGKARAGQRLPGRPVFFINRNLHAAVCNLIYTLCRSRPFNGKAVNFPFDRIALRRLCLGYRIGPRARTFDADQAVRSADRSLYCLSRGIIYSKFRSCQNSSAQIRLFKQKIRRFRCVIPSAASAMMRNPGIGVSKGLPHAWGIRYLDLLIRPFLITLRRLQLPDDIDAGF